ncbi:hypothetical protein DFH07DRAFT_966902 [Mycena maculata]|uniref:Nucleoplasmin-like domain-containing protein n=1 Tax=Mycena maculata TaxID=230809 RepID=A0AAD7MX20_9AGAR|nr:hypothetical protein DFH07DRAFT_966902 [Mycena maculata]
MALERKYGQWSCQIPASGEAVAFDVPPHDIVVTNVSLGYNLSGDGRSTLVLYHVNAHPQGEEDTMQEVEFAPVHLILNRTEHIALQVQGDNDIYLFGHYLAYHKPPPASNSVGGTQTGSSTGGFARPQSRMSHGGSASSRQGQFTIQASQSSSSKRKIGQRDDEYADGEAAYLELLSCCPVVASFSCAIALGTQVLVGGKAAFRLRTVNGFASPNASAVGAPVPAPSVWQDWTDGPSGRTTSLDEVSTLDLFAYRHDLGKTDHHKESDGPRFAKDSVPETFSSGTPKQAYKVAVRKLQDQEHGMLSDLAVPNFGFRLSRLCAGDGVRANSRACVWN